MMRTIWYKNPFPLKVKRISLSQTKEVDTWSIRILSIVRTVDFFPLLLDVKALKSWEPEEMADILAGGLREKAGELAPARGLTLMEVRY